jgi:putative hydrolase of the HAD superfamily
MSYIARYRTILFDLNGTLAHDHDRFGADQDYHETYRRLGGCELGAVELSEIIADSLARLIRRYETGCPDNFPEYRHFVSEAAGLTESELRLVENTVAEHEFGRISPLRAESLERLSQDHTLGVVSDLWAPAHRCRRYFMEEGLDALFRILVFSCEVCAVKPSRKPFVEALSALDADPATTLFVGNDLRRDIEGAAACGMRTVWLTDREDARPDVGADYVIRDIGELQYIQPSGVCS